MMLGILYTHMQKNVFGPLSHAVYKSNSKWIKDLNTRPEAVKLLEENMGSFLDIILKAWAAKVKIDKWDCLKLESFCITKEINLSPT